MMEDQDGEEEVYAIVEWRIFLWKLRSSGKSFKGKFKFHNLDSASFDAW
jgi:hypothetical protein